MNKIKKLKDWQYYLIFAFIFLVIWSFAFGILHKIPETYHPHYALFVSMIFLVDVLCLPPLKKWKMSEDEKRGYVGFCVMGLILILWSLILLFMKIHPGSWMWSFVFSSSFLTSAIIFQYLRNREVIP
jgi:hypothetical protein